MSQAAGGAHILKRGNLAVQGRGGAVAVLVLGGQLRLELLDLIRQGAQRPAAAAAPQWLWLHLHIEWTTLRSCAAAFGCCSGAPRASCRARQGTHLHCRPSQPVQREAPNMKIMVKGWMRETVLPASRALAASAGSALSSRGLSAAVYSASLAAPSCARHHAQRLSSRWVLHHFVASRPTL